MTQPGVTCVQLQLHGFKKSREDPCMLALLRCTSVSLWKGPLSMFRFEEQENYQSDIFAVVDALSSYPNRLSFSPQVPGAPRILVAQSGAG
ncbi:hypothetical protein EV1_023433 [Malus domestica]